MDNKKAKIPELLQDKGGLKSGVSREVSRETGAPEAMIYGVGSFFHLLSNPDTKVRVCTGLSCQLAGANKILEAAKAAGLPVEGCSCLAACDQPPVVLRDRDVITQIQLSDIEQTGGDWKQLKPEIASGGYAWSGAVGPDRDDSEKQVFNLLGQLDWSGAALKKASAMDPDDVIQLVEDSGLQGRGGAGFPAHIKWRAVREQQEPQRYLVLNADEGEPGTFKDGEIMMRRPDLIIEGLAIAARTVGATDIYLYLRGEFTFPKIAMATALEKFSEQGLLDDLNFHFHDGQGAYICGEETALLEALEGKRGMPRLKPPFPVENGLWGKPTLIHNVETIACVPPVMLHGGEWFKDLGRTEPGTKLYCISGHVQNPGTYELPLGVTLDELVAEAGGYVGTLKAFCPGGASSGFLPATMSNLPLDFKGLAKVGSMLGSAGIIVLNNTVNMKWAAGHQLRFFEDESCGQCAPCRIGTRYLREAIDASIEGTESPDTPNLEVADEVAWQMNEGSICGLGQIAALPLTTARKYFPEDFI
ncbi:MAG: NADH-ubiquinone oxidoreductase-F iron-sulfur binding region domain-containing protein [Calditrichia bacterium]